MQKKLQNELSSFKMFASDVTVVIKLYRTLYSYNSYTVIHTAIIKLCRTVK